MARLQFISLLCKNSSETVNDCLTKSISSFLAWCKNFPVLCFLLDSEEPQAERKHPGNLDWNEDLHIWERRNCLKVKKKIGKKEKQETEKELQSSSYFTLFKHRIEHSTWSNSCLKIYLMIWMAPFLKSKPFLLSSL